MEKKWAEENERIMREHPAAPDDAPQMLPLAESAASPELPLDVAPSPDKKDGEQ